MIWGGSFSSGMPVNAGAGLNGPEGLFQSYISLFLCEKQGISWQYLLLYQIFTG